MMKNTYIEVYENLKIEKRYKSQKHSITLITRKKTMTTIIKRVNITSGGVNI
ncbi:hypothetical protein PXD04_08725 [Methanosphaera sp. ISO3-F5]|uniref:hypothetical protein n=1 Tax=Methanosphaera sp. ISO3-F5 TaxID=1452353 RepID=UPI002B25ABAC|nr:hypothetical protein [Methanosphaera sp. ISO3-F5]WQH63773.1 hypothetical protein PXD04_08725 [Methanosphaera sp. ISO3-F5]